MDSYGIVVIGGGPAGMAAAVAAREAGVKKILLIERDRELGGILQQCIHNGFGLHHFKEDLTGPEFSERYIRRMEELAIPCRLDTTVLQITANREIMYINAEEGVKTVSAEAIVLAMGCRERSRGALNIPGTRPSGVLTAGTAQRFVNVEGFVPGNKTVILGSGDIGMIMARRLTLEGAQVEAVVEILPYIGGLIRNEVQCLHDFEIPLFLQHTVTRIHGEERVNAVTIAQVDGRRNPIAGTERTIACDTLLLSVGLIPENELSSMAGIQLDPVTGGALVDEMRQTNVPGVFAGGNVLHVHDLVDNVSWESELAGESAAKFAIDGKQGKRGEIRVKAGRNIRYVVPQTISGQREATLYMRVSEPEEMVRIKVGDIMTKGVRVVKPSEMLKIELSAEVLKKLKDGTKEIIVDCEKRGGK